MTISNAVSPFNSTSQRVTLIKQQNSQGPKYTICVDDIPLQHVEIISLGMSVSGEACALAEDIGRAIAYITTRNPSICLDALIASPPKKTGRKTDVAKQQLAFLTHHVLCLPIELSISILGFSHLDKRDAEDYLYRNARLYPKGVSELLRSSSEISNETHWLVKGKIGELRVQLQLLNSASWQRKRKLTPSEIELLQAAISDEGTVVDRFVSLLSEHIQAHTYPQESTTKTHSVNAGA
ncbi:hypothetical protein GCE9029_00070 [Grimontia celer]|uniref:Uncharacterized protein n=1 Tax=Grimontia celer TaxID=1796497 RepID=A0A128ESX1_9GAMM|nr:hypothetical protein [Grimontia celer]CZF77205.1 hypothetical protein GCE9029_00070 [Grimontia celer]